MASLLFSSSRQQALLAGRMAMRASIHAHAPALSSEAASAGSKLPKERVRHNLFDLLQATSRKVEGRKVARPTWAGYDSYWTITRIDVKPKTGRTGKAFGIRTWGGKTDDKVTKIPGVHKCVWKEVK